MCVSYLGPQGSRDFITHIRFWAHILVFSMIISEIDRFFLGSGSSAIMKHRIGFVGSQLRPA